MVTSGLRKGQIYWCGLDPVAGHEQGSVRPVIIVSADAYNATRSPLVGIVPLTRSAAKNPIHLGFSTLESGLDTVSTALTDHARFIDRTRLRGTAIGVLTPLAMEALDRQLRRLYGI